jgi:hypothetical protein
MPKLSLLKPLGGRSVLRLCWGGLLITTSLDFMVNLSRHGWHLGFVSIHIS